MTPRLLAFSDLDDTLFQTQGKCPDGAALELAAHHDTPARRSYTTRPQRDLLALVEGAGGVVIPVTGRTPQALGRVQRRFPAEAICDHGATILNPGGTVDPVWAAQIQAELADGAVDQVTALVARIAEAHGCTLTTHHVGDAPYMHVLKQPQRGDLQPAYATLRGKVEILPGLTLIANPSHISLLHAGVSKAAAVEYVRARYPDDVLTLGLGDSLSDLPFMRRCDFWLAPPGTQIDRALAPDGAHL